MTTTLPMLSGEGWLQDPKLIMNRLFQHMYLTDHSQSNVYRGNVTSLQYLLAKHGHAAAGLTVAVESAVKTYYGRYFDNVQCTFNRNDTESSDSTLVFDLYISGSWKGTHYDLNRTIKADNSTGTLRFEAAAEMTGESNE